jgi:choice-of-anchor C domain-containing protein
MPIQCIIIGKMFRLSESMKRVLTLAIGLVLLLACVGTVAAETELVVNGGFEVPPVTGNWNTYSGSELTGWTINSGGSIDLIHDYWYSPEGTQSIDLAGSTPAKISQTINTADTHGTYTLSFWLAGNPYDPAKGVKGLNVYWDGTLIKSTSFDTTYTNVDKMGWTLVTISGLKATKTTTEIAFEQGTTSNPAVGVALDGISVVDPVTPAPEFPSMALPAAMLVGFMGVVLFVQKSKNE